MIGRCQAARGVLGEERRRRRRRRWRCRRIWRWAAPSDRALPRGDSLQRSQMPPILVSLLTFYGCRVRQGFGSASDAPPTAGTGGTKGSFKGILRAKMVAATAGMGTVHDGDAENGADRPPDGSGSKQAVTITEDARAAAAAKSQGEIDKDDGTYGMSFISRPEAGVSHSATLSLPLRLDDVLVPWRYVPFLRT